MGGVGETVLHSGDRRVDLGSDSQVGVLSQELVGEVEAVEGIGGGVASSENLDVLFAFLLDAEFDVLSLPQRLDELPLDSEAEALFGLSNFFPVGQIARSHDLEGFGRAAVIEFDEYECVLLSQSGEVSPTCHSNFLVDVLLIVSQNFIDSKNITNQTVWFSSDSELFGDLELDRHVHSLIRAEDGFGEGKVRLDWHNVGNPFREIPELGESASLIENG